MTDGKTSTKKKEVSENKTNKPVEPEKNEQLKDTSASLEPSQPQKNREIELLEIHEVALNAHKNKLSQHGKAIKALGELEMQEVFNLHDQITQQINAMTREIQDALKLSREYAVLEGQRMPDSEVELYQQLRSVDNMKDEALLKINAYIRTFNGLLHNLVIKQKAKYELAAKIKLLEV